MGARKMVKIRVDETSGVDHPSHLEEGWIVIKAKGHEMPAEKKSTPVFKDADGDEIDVEATLAKAAQDVTAANTERDTATARVTELETENAALKKAAEPAADDAEALEKSLPEPVRALLKKERDATAAAQTELRKEVETRLNGEYVAKAAAWGSLSLDPAEVGTALRQLSTANPTLAESVIKALASANAQAEASDLFKELGTPLRPDSGDAYGRMTKMAKAKVEAGEAPTIEQAMDEVATAHPELVEAYNQEQTQKH